MSKFLIISGARSGKDSLAEYWRDNFDFEFKSSSQVAIDKVIYPVLKDKYGYKTKEECYEDRVNHRAEWYDLIKEYNKEDRSKLAKEVLKDSDCYVGMRDLDELLESKRQRLFDLIIWIDASKRVPPEGKDSFNIDKSYADIIIENNGTLQEFQEKAFKFGNLLLNH